MRRIIWHIAFVALVAVRLAAQSSLEFFTNQANALLEPAFGYGVANIPIYSSTNTNVAYSASLHYLLQSAANAYDATTPATNSPSVFRPLFAWTSNTLFIVGYANVTTDFYAQTGLGFKALADPTISSNDNVWGIPWVVGMKNYPPAFYGYSYSTAVFAERQLLFVRGTQANGQPDTNRPPVYTNQFFEMSISNLFGVGAWNFSPSNFPDSVTIVASNQVSITLTNGCNWGTNFAVSVQTNCIVNSWPGWSGSPSQTNSFLIPILTNVISLPASYWSGSSAKFFPFTNGIISTNAFLAGDMEQTGWPVYNWVLNITNNLMYALLDNRSGQVLDFVNLGGFGSSLPITNVLANSQPGSGLGIGPTPPLMWVIGNATDLPNSPMSAGVLNQITYGSEESPAFANSLTGVPAFGTQPCINGQIFGAPFNPSNVIIQSCSWQSVNPLVHYVLADLETLETNEVEFVSIPPIPRLTNNLGKLNEPFYNSGAVENLSFGLNAGMFQLNFSGANDLPYAIWSSTDLLNWSQIGTATQIYPWLYPQPYSRPFQFNDLSVTNYPARFYQVRLP
jgi:hypothetical protein